ncbi:MAG: peptide chain release factor N(5)-glutamine methyltransferase [bacterium]
MEGNKRRFSESYSRHSLSKWQPDRPWTIGEALEWGIKRLEATRFVLKPRRHTELILEKVLGCDRINLYLNARQPLSHKEWMQFLKLLRKRERGEPVQYIVGWTLFYGLRLAIRKGVFIPRYDSEALVERLIERYREVHSHLDNGHPDWKILDICCGSGALGLAVAVELSGVKVILTDNDPRALRAATFNARQLGCNDRVTVQRWDALTQPPSHWQNSFDALIANPPYIPHSEIPSLHPDVRDGEPLNALTDGSDGLTFYRHWVKILPLIMKTKGWAFIEVGDSVAQAAGDILKARFAWCQPIYDLSGHLRGWECRKE